jgi:RND family efflux transporter MFP subunit
MHSKYSITTIFLTIVCIIQTFLLVFYFSVHLDNNINTDQEYINQVEPVNACIIDKKSFIGFISTYGQIKSKYHLNYKLPNLHGYSPKISKINFHAGKLVYKDDILMELECNELRHKAEATRKDTEQKKLYYDKIVNLKSATSEYEISRALFDYQKSLAEYYIMVEAMRNLIIIAPFRGITSKCDLSIGEIPDTNKTLFSLHDQDNLMVEFYVDNTDLEFLQKDTKIAIESIDHNNNEIKTVAEAVITGINPYVDDQTGKIKVIAEIQSNDFHGDSIDLKHNMHVYIYFDKKPIHDVYILIKSAILENNNGSNYVRKIININGQDEITMIKINISDHNHNTYAITSDLLQNGDRIVVEGGSKRDGQLVSVNRIFEA